MIRRKKTRRVGTTIDLGPRSLKVSDGERAIEIELKRDSRGRLDNDCRRAVVDRMQEFLNGQTGPAWCAIPSRGVSLRAIDLPPVADTDSAQMLALQVEREFPMGSDQLAWGYRLDSVNGTNGTIPSHPRATLVALRRDALEDYRTLFSECGLDVTFTLGALAAAELAESNSGTDAVLDLGRSHSELLIRTEACATSVRTVAWGGDRVTRAIAEGLGIDFELAEEHKIAWSEGRPDGDERITSVVSLCVQSELADLSRLLQEAWHSSDGDSKARRAPEVVFLAGRGRRLRGIDDAVKRTFDEASVVTLIPEADDADDSTVSAATLGLRRGTSIALDSGTAGATSSPENGPTRIPVGWIAAVVVLSALAFFLPKVEPLTKLDEVERKLSAAQASLGSLPSVSIDHRFLDHLDRHQLPSLLVLHDLFAVSPGNLQFREFTVDQSGAVVFRGVVGTRDEVYAIRNGMIDRRWFTAIELPEVGPVKNGSGIEFRITARLTKKSDRVPIVLAVKDDDGSVNTEKPSKATGPKAAPPTSETPDPNVTGPPDPEATLTIADKSAESPPTEEVSGDVTNESTVVVPSSGLKIDGSTFRINGLNGSGGITFPDGEDSEAMDALRKALEEQLSRGLPGGSNP